MPAAVAHPLGPQRPRAWRGPTLRRQLPAWRPEHSSGRASPGMLPGSASTAAGTGVTQSPRWAPAAAPHTPLCVAGGHTSPRIRRHAASWRACRPAKRARMSFSSREAAPGHWKSPPACPASSRRRRRLLLCGALAYACCALSGACLGAGLCCARQRLPASLPMTACNMLISLIASAHPFCQQASPAASEHDPAT